MSLHAKRLSHLYRRGLAIAIALACPVAVRAQSNPPLTGVEPGLNEAVRWIWKVQLSPTADWGLPLPEPPPGFGPGLVGPLAPARNAADSYIVKRGDALILIAKKFGITVDQLKYANALDSNLIRVDQVLTIPTPEEVALMPPALAGPTPRPAAGPGASANPTGFDPEVLLFQIYLDRKNFSSGPIDGKSHLGFQKLMFISQTIDESARDIEAFRARAQASVGELFTTYQLRPEDFRFIAPPRAVIAEPEATPSKKKKAPTPAPTPPPPTYDTLTIPKMLAYRSPWEFVAERFHCDEAFLRKMNPSVKGIPAAGTQFRVPNVAPFEIENALNPPLQPQAAPDRKITAAVVDLSRLEIYENDRLIAIFPISSARPGLRGRGTWTILDAVPRPRLATIREPRVKPRPASTFFRGENPATVPEPVTLDTDEFLAAGPNNPVGIIWIDLAKSGDPTPLPFGLHGTSIPDAMFQQESLGGFRMTNWDIARAVRMLPPGTPLEWKQSEPPTIQPPG